MRHIYRTCSQVVAISLVALLLFGLLTAFGAPRPFVKPSPKALSLAEAIIGSWDMTWLGDGPLPCTFHPRGGFSCFYHGTWWRGEWSVSPDGKKLTISEWVPRNGNQGPPPDPFTWSVDMEAGKLQGKMVVGDGEVKLVAPKHGKRAEPDF